MAKHISSAIILITIVAVLATSCKCRICDLRPLRERNSEVEMSIIYDYSELPCNYLTLDEAILVALERNLDLLVKEWEGAVQRETMNREFYKLLQSLTFSGELSWRNKNTGSSSESLDPLVPPAPPSISSNQTVRRWDLTYTFNLLDFGVGYFRTRQENDKAIMQTIEYARLQNNLILDVTRQYWKVLYAQRAIEKSKELIARLIEQRELIRKEVEARTISELPALKAEDQLLSVEITLHGYQKEYHEGKMELARLMGYPACLEFEIATIGEFVIDAEVCDPCALSDLALIERPELFSLDLEELIGVNETLAAIVQLFPALAPFAGMNYDGNTFLIHNFWLIAGVRAAWNLFSIPSHIAEMRIGQNDRMASRARRMALSIGIISQVHLAYYLYQDNLKQFRLFEEQRLLKKKIFETSIRQFRVGLTSGIDVLNYQGELYITELLYLRSYAELQIALEQLNNAMGVPLNLRNHVTFVKPGDSAKNKPPKPQEKKETIEKKEEIKEVIDELDAELLKEKVDDEQENKKIEEEFFSPPEQEKKLETPVKELQKEETVTKEEPPTEKSEEVQEVQLLEEKKIEEIPQIQSIEEKKNEEEERLQPGIHIESESIPQPQDNSEILPPEEKVKIEDMLIDFPKDSRSLIREDKSTHSLYDIAEADPKTIIKEEAPTEKIEEVPEVQLLDEKKIEEEERLQPGIHIESEPIPQPQDNLEILPSEEEVKIEDIFIDFSKDSRPLIKEDKSTDNLYDIAEADPKTIMKEEPPSEKIEEIPEVQLLEEKKIEEIPQIQPIEEKNNENEERLQPGIRYESELILQPQDNLEILPPEVEVKIEDIFIDFSNDLKPVVKENKTQANLYEIAEEDTKKVIIKMEDIIIDYSKDFKPVVKEDRTQDNLYEIAEEDSKNVKIKMEDIIIDYSKEFKPLIKGDKIKEILYDLPVNGVKQKDSDIALKEEHLHKEENNTEGPGIFFINKK